MDLIPSCARTRRVRRRAWLPSLRPPRSSTRSRTSTRSRARPPARWASRSSCPPPPPATGSPTPSTPTAIDAQAHLMRDLLRTFAAVPLALAAYNAGRARPACGCVPPIPETQSYVADLLGLLHGAGDPSGDGAGGAPRALSHSRRIRQTARRRSIAHPRSCSVRLKVVSRTALAHSPRCDDSNCKLSLASSAPTGRSSRRSTGRHRGVMRGRHEG
jgi:hypothetical protein